jgi:L-fuconolactonase
VIDTADIGGPVEDAIEPELPICDPHHHLWNEPDSRYLLNDLKADAASGHNVLATVYIECMSSYRAAGPDHLKPVGETEFVIRADPNGFVAAIVGYADLRSPAVEDVIAAHLEAGAGRFRGIRQPCATDPSPAIRPSARNPPSNLLADKAFRSGLAAAGRAGLSFDAWLYHPQIGELVDLALAQPDVLIILDHLGGPLGVGPYRDRGGVVDSWRASMTRLSQCSNVMVKLGGIGMRVFGVRSARGRGGATSQELSAFWGDQISWCIEQFGVDRCMFESNFPLDRATCSYLVLWNAFKKIVVGASAAEKAALFSGTARRAYRLHLADTT